MADGHSQRVNEHERDKNLPGALYRATCFSVLAVALSIHSLTARELSG